MRLAFLHVNQDPTLAYKMVESVRRFADCEALQLTDMDTAAMDGCTPVRRVYDGENMTLFKLEHLASLSGDLLILDTDLIVQKDITKIFDFDFDLALTWRDGPIPDQDGNDITKLMPINTGVMFSRCQRFWQTCFEWSKEHPGGWYSDQLAVSAQWRRFNIMRLHCDNFNYTPKSKDEDVSSRYVVHYKGKRKGWMC